MYIYLDESGNFCLSERSKETQPYMVIAAIVIKDKRSKAAIAQAVTRAIVDWRRSHQEIRANPENRIKELKGAGLPPEVRRRLFKLISRRNPNFEIHAIGVDKRDQRLAKQPLPNEYMRRYAVLVHDILSFVRPIIRSNQRWVTMVSDSQARAQPIQPGPVRYSCRRVRLLQVKLRKQDRQRGQQYRDFVTHRFRTVLRKRGTHLAVGLRRSEDDRCLQFADVVVNFIYEGLVLRNKSWESRKKLRAATGVEERKRVTKQLEHTGEKLKRWGETRHLLAPRLHFLLAYRLYDKAVYRVQRDRPAQGRR